MILETNSNSSSSTPPSSADSSPSKQQSTYQESNQANRESNQESKDPKTDKKCNEEGLKFDQKIKSGSSTVSLSATVSTHQLDTFIPSGTGQKLDTFTGHHLDTFTPERIVSRSVSNLILDQDAEGASTTEIIMTLKWDKLSPAEFQQLQDYIQCEFLFLSLFSFCFFLGSFFLSFFLFSFLVYFSPISWSGFLFQG